MTNNQINAAIAVACGWKAVCVTAASGFYKGFDNGAKLRPDLPDYCNDLNAMHEAESWLSPIDMDHYIDVLGDMFDNAWAFALATARQRAEAFLRTLGKWEEVQG